MAAKEIAVKKYVVKLSDEERGRLTALITKGKHPALRPGFDVAVGPGLDDHDGA